MSTPNVLWSPESSQYPQTGLADYEKWLEKKLNLTFESYEELWEWSTRHVGPFWETILQYFDVCYDGSYEYVLQGNEMPEIVWFEGISLNYAEHIFARAQEDQPALLVQQEGGPLEEITWQDLRRQVGALAAWLKQQGISKGDRIVAYVPNIAEAVIAFLAANSLGAVWSSCSPDFGQESVIERFGQIAPKLLFTVTHYQYAGKQHDRSSVVSEMVFRLPTLQKVVVLDQGKLDTTVVICRWEEVLQREAKLQFARIPFGDPIWVLFSSGTTGQPKAITHGVGGVLLEHFKYLVLMNDVRPGERFFWYTTTGWMMWNFLQASMLAGATPILYQGSPTYPNDLALWDLADQAKINHFGTSPTYLMHLNKQGLLPNQSNDLSSLRSIGSTGSPLPPAMFVYVYQHIKKDIWLCSMSGGTDVCTAFIGSVPGAPVIKGEIQGAALGVSLRAFDESGHAVRNEVGEMVITQPMPSMPIYFWNDPEGKRYRSSYFEMYPGGVWRHGDWIRISDRGGIVILGRSDATLNRRGVRIGTAEIYRPLSSMPEISDCLIVNLEYPSGHDFMPLFVKLAPDHQLSEDLISRIKSLLRTTYSPRHVPDKIIAVPDIPYTISGKKMEAPIKRILLGQPPEQAANLGAMRNPEALNFFMELYTAQEGDTL